MQTAYLGTVHRQWGDGGLISDMPVLYVTQESSSAAAAAAAASDGIWC
jgi:hypothetical protein